MTRTMNMRKYTLKEYMKWKESERWQLIDGELYNIDPAPPTIHQEILSNIFCEIKNNLVQKSFVYMNLLTCFKEEYENDYTTVLTPDIVIFRDKENLNEQGLYDTPDAVVEIISNKTAGLDYKEKLFIYQKYGVKEYIIINPYDKIVMVYRLLQNGEYSRASIYEKNDVLSTNIIKNIDLSEIF